MRQSLGATTFRIVRQTLMENLLLSLPSGAAGLLSGMALTHRLDDIWIPLDPAPQASVPPYSGASVAGCPTRPRPGCEPRVNDDAKVATFMFQAPPLRPGQTKDLYLLAIIESAQDPVGPATKASMSPGRFAPQDNNVTLRRVSVKAPS